MKLRQKPQILWQYSPAHNYCTAQKGPLTSWLAACRRVHKAEVMKLREELRGASTGAKGGAAAAERLKKDLEKTR